MRILVTGVTGNVGTALAEALVADPAVTEVVGVARRPPRHGIAGVRYESADVAADDLAPLLAGVDAVAHLAWLFQPTRDPAVTWRANAVGSRRLIRAAVDAGVRSIVHASSVGAYSPAPGRVVDESWPTDGTSSAAYAREKAYVERVIDAAESRDPGVRFVRLRPAFIFQRRAASGQRRLFAGPFVPNALLRPGRLPAVPLPAGLRFQALHTVDAAAAYRSALLGTARGAFNIAAPDVLDADAVAAALGSRAVPVPDRLARAAVSAAWHLRLVPADPALVDMALGLPILDTARARGELGWSATRSGLGSLTEVLAGMGEGAGAPTEPLAPDSVRGRVEELATGVGARDVP